MPDDAVGRDPAGAVRPDPAGARSSQVTPADGDGAAREGEGGPGDGAARDGENGARRRAGLRPLLLSVVVAVAVLGLVVAVALSRTPEPAPGGVVADGAPPLLREGAEFAPTPLPDATLPALGGFGPPAGRDLAELRDEPVVINFWASWCAPCVREMPALQRVADDLGIRVIGVDYIDQDDKAIELAEELGITYELLRDDDGEFGRAVGLLGTPTTLLVDDGGTIVRRLTGELSERDLRDAIAADLR